MTKSLLHREGASNKAAKIQPQGHRWPSYLLKCGPGTGKSETAGQTSPVREPCNMAVAPGRAKVPCTCPSHGDQAGQGLSRRKVHNPVITAVSSSRLSRLGVCSTPHSKSVNSHVSMSQGQRQML